MRSSTVCWLTWASPPDDVVTENRLSKSAAACRYHLPSGDLVFTRIGVVFAVPFDLRALQVTGTPVPVVERLLQDSSQGAVQLAISKAGSIAYVDVTHPSKVPSII